MMIGVTQHIVPNETVVHNQIETAMTTRKWLRAPWSTGKILKEAIEVETLYR